MEATVIVIERHNFVKTFALPTNSFHIFCLFSFIDRPHLLAIRAVSRNNSSSSLLLRCFTTAGLEFTSCFVVIHTLQIVFLSCFLFPYTRFQHTGRCNLVHKASLIFVTIYWHGKLTFFPISPIFLLCLLVTGIYEKYIEKIFGRKPLYRVAIGCHQLLSLFLPY